VTGWESGDGRSLNKGSGGVRGGKSRGSSQMQDRVGDDHAENELMIYRDAWRRGRRQALWETIEEEVTEVLDRWPAQNNARFGPL
jgi:hypothetical protein